MKKILLCFLTYLFLTSFVGNSQDGQLDTSFGSGGIVQSDFFGTADFGFALDQQADGKIIAVGGVQIDPDRIVPALARYLADGSVDTSFGDNGIVVTDYNTPFAFDNYSDVAVQDDQKIIAGGNFGCCASSNIMLARYLSNGDLDPGFGIDGITITDLGDDDRFSEMTILNDGKILLVGITKIGGGNKVTLFQYLSDGNPDPAFGDNGKVVTIHIAPIDTIFSIKVLEDNKILASGLANGSFRLFKFEADGSSDLSFGDNGVAIIGTSASNQSPFDITAEGKIIVGMSRSLGNDEFEGYLKRFLPDGSPDTTFGGDGEVTLSYKNLRPLSIIIQPNQLILIYGSANFGIDSIDAVVTRYRMTGVLDTTFGQAGVARIFEVIPNDIMLQDDGKIVWIGWVNFELDFLLARYLNDPFTLGLEDQIINGLKVFPNPSRDIFTVQSEDFLNNEPYQITDMTGKVLQKGRLSGKRTSLDLSLAQSGLYFLKAANSNIRLVKE